MNLKDITHTRWTFIGSYLPNSFPLTSIKRSVLHNKKNHQVIFTNKYKKESIYVIYRKKQSLNIEKTKTLLKTLSLMGGFFYKIFFGKNL